MLRGAFRRHRRIDARGDDERTGRSTESRRRQLEQHRARLGGSASQLCSSSLHGLTTDRRSLVDRTVAVALHPRDAIEGRVELLGDDLPECGGYPRTQLDFAAENCDRSVGGDDEPGVELVRGKGDGGRGDGGLKRETVRGAPREKPTARMPVRLRKSRRETSFESSLIIAASLRDAQCRRAFDGAHDSHVRSTAAQVGVQRRADLGSRRLLVASDSAAVAMIMPLMQ